MMTTDNEWPSGAVTFLFTDIEDSTPLWDRHRAAMRPALAEHDALLQTAVTANDGVIVKTTGDGAMAAFASPSAALSAALDAQRALQDAQWEAIAPDRIRVRMGLHTGEAELRAGDYYGTAVNRAARLMSIGHGGQVLLSDTVARLIEGDLPHKVSLLDLGEQRLKGFSQPARIYQVQTESLPRDFPPLRSGEFQKGNLPLPLTSFVGRETELASIEQLLKETRLLTLTGPGGTGKTRVSLEVARDVQDNYAHGAWLVELAPLTDPGAVPAAVAGLWGLRDNGMMPLEQVIVDYLRGKELLLILDNCEHLVDACAQLAARLLAAAPRLTILASSREGLGAPGETTYHLPTLRIPGREVVDLEILQKFESVQLFVERALSVRPEFALTPRNAEAIGRIVRRLDGIPLAIELAAARLNLLPPEQLAERLDDRFRLLTGGSRTALPRQQTLRALIDWSYDLLDPAEQALFRQLGVFTGGLSLEAAEAIIDLRGFNQSENLRGFDQYSIKEYIESKNLAGLDLLDLLANLVNKSLIIMEEQEGQARYRFLETIRQYARDRLFETGEGPAVRDRHLATFSDLVLEGIPPGSDETHLTLFWEIGSEAGMGWAGQIRSEIDNVRTAMRWALQTDPERALAMASKLPAFFVFEGPAFEARQWIVEALRAVENLEPASGEAARLRETVLLQGWIAEGNLKLGEENYVEAAELFQAIAARSRQLDLPRLLTMALSMQSQALILLGRPEAYDKAAESLEIMEELGEKRLQAMPLSNMALVKMQQGDYAAAQALKERAEERLPDAGHSMPVLITMQAYVASMIAQASGDLDAALRAMNEGVEALRLNGSRHLSNSMDSQRGHILRRSGDLDGALKVYRRTILEWQHMGRRAAVANQLECFAFIALAQEKPARAARLLGAAEALREPLNDEMTPEEKQEYDAHLASLHEALDADTLQEAWQAGRGLDLDSAVNLALSTGGSGES